MSGDRSRRCRMTARDRCTPEQIAAAVRRAELDAADVLPEDRATRAYNHLLGALGVLCELDIDQIRADIAAGVVA